MAKECPAITDFPVSFDCNCQRCKSRVFGIVGFSGAAIILLGMLIAVISYPGYNFSNQFVSDLGMVTTSPASGLFNGTMIVGGITISLFSFMFLAFPTRHRYLAFGATFFGFMTGIAIAMDGFYPYDTDTIVHATIAIFVFTGMIGSSISFSMAMIYQEKENMPMIFSVAGFAAFVMLIVLAIYAASHGIIPDISSRPAVYHASIIEWIGIMLYLSWIFSMGLYEMF